MTSRGRKEKGKNHGRKGPAVTGFCFCPLHPERKSSLSSHPAPPQCCMSPSCSWSKQWHSSLEPSACVSMHATATHPLRGHEPTAHQAGPSAPAVAVNHDVPALHHARPLAPVIAVNQVVPATPPSAFPIHPMDWLLAGPSSPFLGEEENFNCNLAPPPLPS